MGENTLRPFAYAHSSAIMKALVAVAQNWRHYIAGGYQFIEKPGEHTEFDKMIKLAKDIDRINPLYVDTVKEFAGTSLADFKNALTAIEEAKLDIVSAAEPQYNYHHFMAAIEVLEDLEPGYIKNREGIMVAAMFKAGTDLGDICQYTGLKESFVLQAVADYKEEQEQAEEQGT
ncbi:MAG: hypothetical protein GX025_10205 [Clostridiales bacterium]|nr:hypothetical protein [Clostridiales bacterium]